MTFGTVSTNIWMFSNVQAGVFLMLAHFYGICSCGR